MNFRFSIYIAERSKNIEWWDFFEIYKDAESKKYSDNKKPACIWVTERAQNKTHTNIYTSKDAKFFLIAWCNGLGHWLRIWRAVKARVRISSFPKFLDSYKNVAKKRLNQKKKKKVQKFVASATNM